MSSCCAVLKILSLLTLLSMNASLSILEVVFWKKKFWTPAQTKVKAKIAAIISNGWLQTKLNPLLIVSGNQLGNPSNFHFDKNKLVASLLCNNSFCLISHKICSSEIKDSTLVSALWIKLAFSSFEKIISLYFKSSSFKISSSSFLFHTRFTVTNRPWYNVSIRRFCFSAE